MSNQCLGDKFKSKTVIVAHVALECTQSCGITLHTESAGTGQRYWSAGTLVETAIGHKQHPACQKEN